MLRASCRQGCFVLLLALVVAAPGRAQADVAAMRLPMLNRGVAFELGVPETSVGYWVNDWLGVAGHARVPLTSLGGSVVLRRSFVGKLDRGFGLAGIASFGLEVPTLSPAFVFSASGSLLGRYIGEWWFAQLGATVPLALRLTDDFAARIPVLGEVWAGGRANAVWLGVHVGLGAVFVTGLLPTFALQLGLAMALKI